MNLDRVVFFSKEDLACFNMLERVEIILNEFDEQIIHCNINDIIEFYHVKQYIDNNLRLDNWSNDLFETYQRKVLIVWSVINRYFSSIDIHNLESSLNEVINEDIRYVKSFWQLLEKCSIYKSIPIQIFVKLFEVTQRKEDILRCRNIVTFFNEPLKNLLLTNKNTAEILLSYYTQIGNDSSDNIIIPKSLTIKDKEDIIDRYIDRDDSNPNYIELILLVRDQSEFRLSPQIRLKAKKRNEVNIANIFKSGQCATYSMQYGVSFSEVQTIPIDISFTDNKLTYTYSIPYIQKDLSDVAIFHNFQRLFNFADYQYRITHVRNRSDIGFFDIIGMHPEKEYLCPKMFEIRNDIANMQLIAYKHILASSFDICLEDVIQNQFNSICSKCNVQNIEIHFEKNTEYLSRIRYICPEIDSILKKYKLFVEYGVVDTEILEMNSSPVRVEDIPSLVHNKYVYSNGGQIDKVMHNLFSDQSMLYSVKEYNRKGYKSLFELLSNEHVSWESLEDYLQPSYQELISLGYIVVEDGYIHFTDMYKITILRDLYNNDVISYYRIPIAHRHIVDKLCQDGILRFESRLFTLAEIDYFNFVLNKSFCNGLDLRNKYVHGSHGIDALVIKGDYYTLLRMSILILMKIIDDILCSTTQQQN